MGAEWLMSQARRGELVMSCECRGENRELKWQGVLGSVLGEQQPRTPGDGRFVSKTENKILPLGGCGSFDFKRENDGSLRVGAGRVRFFRGYFSCCPLILVQDCPSTFVCVGKLLFIGKNVVRSPNLVPQLLSFFVNLIFLIFFRFFLSTST